MTELLKSGEFWMCAVCFVTAWFHAAATVQRLRQRGIYNDYSVAQEFVPVQIGAMIGAMIVAGICNWLFNWTAWHGLWQAVIGRSTSG